MMILVGIVALVVGMEIGWRLRLVQIRQHLAKKGYNVEKVLS